MNIVGTSSVIGRIHLLVTEVHHFATLLDEIEATVPTLAVATPTVQRFTMTAWIARARTLAIASPTPKLAASGVAHITEALRLLARLWRPGTVVALRPQTTPGEAFGGVVARLSTWSEVERRSLLLAQGAPAWSDDAVLRPQPYQPQARLDALTVELERFGGALSQPPDLASGSRGITAARRELSILRRLAAELRWLRGVVDPSIWGAAFGRLRGLARRVEDKDLRQLISPSFSPPDGWAGYLGEDVTLHSLAATAPSPGTDDTSILDWLTVALSSSLPLTKLQPLIGPLSARLASLDCRPPSRRSRKRLRKLLANPPPPRTLKQRQPKRRRTSRHTIPHAPEVRTLVDGKRAALLTNRRSPEICAALEQHVGLSCEVHVNKIRRRQALCDSVRSGRYDLVMVAHGFASHGDTATIREACRVANTPYIAVDKGRPTKIIQALYDSRSRIEATSP